MASGEKHTVSGAYNTIFVFLDYTNFDEVWFFLSFQDTLQRGTLSTVYRQLFSKPCIDHLCCHVLKCAEKSGVDERAGASLGHAQFKMTYCKTQSH